MLPWVVGHEAEQQNYILRYEAEDETGFAVWGEWDEQLTQDELEFVIKEMLSGYYLDE